ncbi:FecR family protein [Sphingomonas soli]|uniref:FecR family protein n=1 Tax=Sphingomonas soli TaxID=266127 RepID=UPI0009FC9D0E|nr:FecR domain-containing protein [Sphingomonas soli]
MPPITPEPMDEESLRAAAAEWYARMRGPDAERHRAAFETWLAEHPAHRQAYVRMALRWDQAGLVGHTPSGQARQGLPASPVRRAMPMRYAALAASLIAVIALSALFWLSPSGTPTVPQVAAREFVSPVGEIRRVTLEDGSVVTLDTGTRLEVAFTSAERRLRLLAGRARFEVAHDSARAFVVMAGEGEVVATGTVFDVSLVGPRPRVRLIEGSVEVRSRAANASPKPVARLVPGQAITLGTPQVTPSPAPPAEERWVSGMLSFDGTPLADAIAEANRYSERRILLGDPALGTLRVTGAFKAGDQVAIAGALAASFGLRVVPGPGGALTLVR